MNGSRALRRGRFWLPGLVRRVGPDVDRVSGGGGQHTRHNAAPRPSGRDAFALGGGASRFAVGAYCQGRSATTQPKKHGAQACEPALGGRPSPVTPEARTLGTWGASPAEAGCGGKRDVTTEKKVSHRCRMTLVAPGYSAFRRWQNAEARSPCRACLPLFCS